MRKVGGYLFGARRSHIVLRLVSLKRNQMLIQWFFLTLFGNDSIARVVCFSLNGRTARRNLWLVVLFRPFGVAVLAFGHLHLLLRLVSSELFYPLLSFPLYLFDLVPFEFFKVIRVCGFIHFDLKCNIFRLVFSHHRFGFFHGEENSFRLCFYLLLLLLFPVVFLVSFWLFVSIAFLDFDLPWGERFLCLWVSIEIWMVRPFFFLFFVLIAFVWLIQWLLHVLRRFSFIISLIVILIFISRLLVFFFLPSFSELVQVRFFEIELLLKALVPLLRVERDLVQPYAFLADFWFKSWIWIGLWLCDIGPDKTMAIFGVVIEDRILTDVSLECFFLFRGFWFLNRSRSGFLPIVHDRQHDLFLHKNLLALLLLLLLLVGRDNIAYLVLVVQFLLSV